MLFENRFQGPSTHHRRDTEPIIIMNARCRQKIPPQVEKRYRNPASHNQPQHPMRGHEPLDEDYLHQFGNLCLISHNKNSRLSNMPPDTKLEDIKVTLSNNKIDSLKLHKMMQMTLSEGKWGKEQIQKHGEEMIELLLSSTDS